MESSLKNEDVRMRIHSRLNSENIKLWLEPYVGKDGSPDNNQIETLAKLYSKELFLNENEVLSALKELQEHSMERATANDKYKETGVAFLRIKVPSQPNGNKIINIYIKLDVTGNELMDTIAAELSVESIRLKLIHRGCVINKEGSLNEQGIKNGAQILVVLLSETPEKLMQDSELYSLMQTTLSDVEFLVDQQDTQYMTVEDQYGNRIDFPAKEKKALTVGMALHERGRKELRNGNYPLALILLLEADKQFCDCNAKILETVDNYALLNLDIVWCYLCLQSITHIPDAETRLKKSEATFIQSYGKNMERLLALKGSSGNEQALFVRLHLLQSIVYYHQNKRVEAKTLIEQTQTELNSLKVDESAMCSLMELGCTASESRMGLRAQNNCVEAAYSFIQNIREERKMNRKRAREEQESRKLGLCSDGKQYVSIAFVKMLQDMGFSKKKAVLALKQSNNHVSNAVQIIQEQPHLLNETSSAENLDVEDFDMNEEALKTLTGLGFDLGAVEKALLENDNILEKAADFLFNTFQGNKSASTDGAGTSSSMSASRLKDQIKNHKRAKETYKRLVDDLDIKEDDYLDLTLQQEEEFLNMYKKLLS